MVQLRFAPEGTKLVEDVTQRRRHAIARIVTHMPTDTRTVLATGLNVFANAAGKL